MKLTNYLRARLADLLRKVLQLTEQGPIASADHTAALELEKEKLEAATARSQALEASLREMLDLLTTLMAAHLTGQNDVIAKHLDIAIARMTPGGIGNRRPH